MNELNRNSIPALLEQVRGLSTGEALERLASLFPGKVTFSTSFSFEDQLISHDILSNNLDISIFTLDTGRMFPETYSVWSRTNEKYNTQITPYYPNTEDIQQFVKERGPNSFYESVENRKTCCHIRKVEPLSRALKGNAVWVTGLRAEHSMTRQGLEMMEWDDLNKVIKFHPLLHWTTEQVRSYIDKEGIPYNPLHDKGFLSIGCAPCTRATRPGEDFRAGRWWWEDQSKKECGLHVTVVS
jgi:phosphoadenosine phosphosulfate reductase